MNILIVDDQKAILTSLETGINWKALGFHKVYFAASAKEAKLIMVNYHIDILMTDIEMPEEDGLKLFAWAREKFADIVGVFLTSHADFDYARKAIELGSFDYILQPASFEEVETCLKRALKKVKQNDYYRKLKTVTKGLTDQRDSILDLLVIRAADENWNECQNILEDIRKSTKTEISDCVFWNMRVQILRYPKKDGYQWNSKLMKTTFRNILEELFTDKKVMVSVAEIEEDIFFIQMAAERELVEGQNWKSGVEDFSRFIQSQMDFRIAVYPDTFYSADFRPERYKALENRMNANKERKTGIFWEDVDNDEEDKSNVARIREAENYIRANISRDLSRLDVAEHFHLNEDYFSRLFKKYTGYTYKDYIIKVRMSQAKKMLASSYVPVSIISSKVGYDNFSYFSKSFKKETGMTPQEYRKFMQEKS